MGLNIVVQTAAGSVHPRWDEVRKAADRQIVDIINSLPALEGVDVEGDRIIRPVDFPAWKKAAPQDAEARSRYLDLVGILEADPGYWITLSY